MDKERIAIQILDAINSIETNQEFIRYSRHIKKYFRTTEPCFYDYHKINNDDIEYFMCNLKYNAEYPSTQWHLAKYIRYKMMQDEYTNARESILKMLIKHSNVEHIQFDHDLSCIRYCKIWRD